MCYVNPFLCESIACGISSESRKLRTSTSTYTDARLGVKALAVAIVVGGAYFPHCRLFSRRATMAPNSDILDVNNRFK